MIWWLIAGVIIAGLLGYSGYLWSLVWYRQRQRKEQVRTRNRQLMDNIHTIAMAMEQHQCDFSEGVIRIAVLLDHLDWSKHNKPDFEQQYPGIYALYEGVRDQPTHTARDALEKQERMRLDSLRIRLEAEFASQIMVDLGHLRAWRGPVY